MISLFCQLADQCIVKQGFCFLRQMVIAGCELLWHCVKHCTVQVIAHVMSPWKFRLIGLVFQFPGLLLDVSLIFTKSFKQPVSLIKFLFLVCQFSFNLSLLVFETLNLACNLCTDTLAVGLHFPKRTKFIFKTVFLRLQIINHGRKWLLFLLGYCQFLVQRLKQLPVVLQLGFKCHTGIGQPSSVFLSRAMPRTRFYNRHPSCKAPFFIDLRKLVVQGKHIILKLQTVLSMENLLESKLAVLVYR